MKKCNATIFIITIILLGCATTSEKILGSFTVSAITQRPDIKDIGFIDNTIVSNNRPEKEYTHLMVIPTSGTAGGEFDASIALFERELLHNGITVIASAVTGRVVGIMGRESSEKIAEATVLSDVERALVMAGESGVDAILQLDLDWYSEAIDTRFFGVEEDGSFVELTREEYAESSKYVGRMALKSRVLSLTGRLIDVDSGQILMSIDMQGAENWAMRGPLEVLVTYKTGYGRSVFSTVSATSINVNEADYEALLNRRSITRRIMSRLADRIKNNLWSPVF